MGNKHSQPQQYIDEQALKDAIKEELIEEITLSTLTTMSAELNHKLFEIEKTFLERMAHAEEKITDLNKITKLINASVSLQNQEIEVLHRVKKSKTPSLLQKLTTFPRVLHGTA
jgi:hypothetical protein